MKVYQNQIVTKSAYEPYSIMDTLRYFFYFLLRPVNY